MADPRIPPLRVVTLRDARICLGNVRPGDYVAVLTEHVPIDNVEAVTAGDQTRIHATVAFHGARLTFSGDSTDMIDVWVTAERHHQLFPGPIRQGG